MWANHRAASAAVFFLCSCTAVARPGAWETALGGNAARTGLVQSAGPAAPDVLWETPLGSTLATPAVVQGTIGITSRITDLGDRSDGSEIVALDLRSGSTLWTAILPRDLPSTDRRSRVVGVRNGLVFATRSGDSNSSYMYALRLHDGSVAWRSRDRVNECSNESPAITPGGDLIVGNFFALLRIDGATGETMWVTPRSTPSSDAGAPALYNGRVYFWEATPDGPRVSAIDAATGQRLASTGALGKAYSQQMTLMVGPGPTVYAPRADGRPGSDALIALRDTGAAFEEIWRFPIVCAPFASMGVGPDGSVYAYAPDRSVVRLRPEDGAVLNATAPLSSDTFHPRMAIDSGGNLFVVNGGQASGRLHAFTPDLRQSWTLQLPGAYLGGPTLTSPGLLILHTPARGVIAIGEALAECDLDWNADGVVDSRDMMMFINDLMDGKADFNADGVTDSNDLFAFLNRFVEGC